jgi:beta-galactosidase
VEIENRYDFSSLDSLTASWTVMADGRELAAGELPPLSIGPGASREVEIPFAEPAAEPGVEYWLGVSFRLAADAPWAAAGHEVAWEQFKLPYEVPAREPDGAAMGELSSQETEEKITIAGSEFSVRFDRASGTMESFRYRDRELIRTGPRPHFWRAPTDNDRGNGMPERCAPWREASREWEIVETTLERHGPGEIEFRARGRLPAVESSHEIVYTVFGNGEVEIASSFQPGAAKLPELPRFGLQMTLPDAFDTVTWYGRGPHESYWDRKTGAAVGVYSGSVDEQYFDYSEPQENGNKTDVRWISLTGSDGVGIQAVGAQPLSVNAQRYTTEEMEVAKHRYEMKRRDFVTLNLDLGQTGVGGDDSWGARPHPRYTLEPKPYHYAFKLRPVGTDQE